MSKQIGFLVAAVCIFATLLAIASVAHSGESRGVYDKYNRYQGRYSSGLGGSYNYYDNRNVYQGRYSPSISGGYNKYNSRNTYQGRGYQIPAQGKGR